MVAHTDRVPSALPSGDPPPPDGRLPLAALERARGRPFGVYVHVPFCERRCGYCDFNTYTASELGPGVSRGGYIDTMLRELSLASDVLGDGNPFGHHVPPVSTIFFGGGTPTLLPVEHLSVVIREIADRFGLAPDVEITTEANPETLTPGYLVKLRAAGFTRISIGMQSAVPQVLAVLDRLHRPGRPEQVVVEARDAGFEHINLDLIYGAPHETDADWQASLDAAIGAGPDHISAYALVVEQGTALARQVASGVVPAPDDDVQADRYVMADETLRAAGYEWYEISNWARTPAGRCRHNELYWSDANWWGFGPGAHSHIAGVRWWNVKHPVRYAAALDAGRSPAAGRETLDDDARLTERVMLGVRRREGLSMLDLPRPAQGVVPQLATWGLVDQQLFEGGRVVLTQRGRLMADAVVKELLTA
jgi:putative oxygen-independent coproporphyrinogen III oxidase